MVEFSADSGVHCDPLRVFGFALASEARGSCYVFQERQYSDDVVERRRVQLQTRRRESQQGDTGRKQTFAGCCGGYNGVGVEVQAD